jgi:hypothetical protein
MHFWIRIRSPDEIFLKMEENLEKKFLHFSKGDFFKADYFRQALIPISYTNRFYAAFVNMVSIYALGMKRNAYII